MADGKGAQAMGQGASHSSRTDAGATPTCFDVVASIDKFEAERIFDDVGRTASHDPEDADRETGGLLATLINQPGMWIYRRVESIHFEGQRRVVRRVSIDFELPHAVLTGSSVFPVPVSLLKKKVLVGFSLWDAGGNSLPVLTRDQNGSLAWSTLVAAVELAGSAVSTDLSYLLWRVATRPVEEARLVAAALTTVTPPPGALGKALTGLRMLPRWPHLHRLIHDLARSFMLMTPIDAKESTRRIIKFEHDEPLQAETLDLLSSLGVRPSTYKFETPGIGFSQSYHLEVLAPRGLVVEGQSSRLEASLPDGLDTRPDAADMDSIAHVYASSLGAGIGEGGACIELRPAPTGLLRNVLWSTWFAFVLLFLGTVWTERVAALGDSADAAAALLLALPGLVLTYLSRPDEHELASRVLRGVRVLSASGAVAVYTAAAAVVLGVSGWPLWATWLVLAAITGLAAMVLTTAHASGTSRVPQA